jgi:protein SCO1/2
MSIFNFPCIIAELQKNNMKYLLPFLFFAVHSCSPKKALPVYEDKIAVMVDGRVDSIVSQLSDFSLIDQKGEAVNDLTIKGKITVVDFFFTSCPTICPKMKKELLRLHKAYHQDNNFQILSFTIDPKRDTAERLNAYSQKLGISSNKTWHFVTGSKDTIYRLAERFMIQAAEDEDAPGGFVHNGKFVLFDKNGKIRGYYDGTKEDKVTQLIEDIAWLQEER